MPPRSRAVCWLIVVAIILTVLSTYRLSAEEIISADDIVRQLAPAKPGALNRSRGIGVVAPPADDLRKMSLSSIEFEFDSDRLTNRAVQQVIELGKALDSETLQSFFFAVQGHTDSSGSEVYNRDLSLRRARAVKHYLSQKQGLPADRLVEVGLGEGFPVAGLLPTDERNRRVEIVKLGLAPPPVAMSVGDGERVRTKRALLIGIDKYKQVSRLNGPVNDALQMASFVSSDLQYTEHNIKLLLDAEATRINILAAIEDWLIAPTASGDEIFLFFSGHGFQHPDDNQDEADGLDETWVPVDVTVQNGSVQGMITDDEIANLLTRLAGRQVYLVVDSCHSGTVARGINDWRYVKTPRLPDGQPLHLSSEIKRTRGIGNTLFQPELFVPSDIPDVTVWTAVRADQKALVDATAKQTPGSVFTRRLLWGVRDGRADSDRDGVVTSRELHDYVLAQSSTYCNQHQDVCSRGLTPQIDMSAEQVQEPAFGRERTMLPRPASLAKDILISPLNRDGIPSGDRVRLDMKPGSEIKIGAELNIVVNSDRDGYLVLLDIDAGGNLVQIFPNELSLKAGLTQQIQAGQSMTLPGESTGFQFQATPPTGRGALIAVVSKKNPRVQKLASRYKDLSVVPHPEAYLVELGEALRSGATRQGEKDGNEWIMGKVEYQIVSQ